MNVRWWRAGAWLRVTLVAVVLLRLADELPGRALGLPRGLRPCAGAAEAARRLRAPVRSPALPPGSTTRWSVWPGPSPTAVVDFATPAGFVGSLWLAARAGDGVPGALLGEPAAFHEMAVRVSGTAATLQAVRLQGEVWEQLSFPVDGRAAVLRFRGRTRDAFQLVETLEVVQP